MPVLVTGIHVVSPQASQKVRSALRGVVTIRRACGMATITIGKYAITKVVELERPFAPAREFFPDLTAEMLEVCQRELPQGQLTPDGWVNMSYHTFLVKTDRYAMLVDTCCGNHKNRTA